LRHLSLCHRTFQNPALADQNAKVLSNGFFRKEKDFNTILIDLFGQLKMICIQNELWVLDLRGNLSW
jgi:hypothetical protein